ncbi:hypothetical protein [Serinibacter salmoneus]|uniref:Uncharacterized protein n=1 Tax=Serinibacter salmoneus TaxID=556530 RepID=A0A2A9CWK1_9MICO|nr:hypothetical protein [Serinibacter salmoneus]PFG18804.1 hypothetical protein ATL40_0348 [Serinibacter salmoneus]
MAATQVAAPHAPGRLGEPIPAVDLLDYLAGLDAWLRDRRATLDGLDGELRRLGAQGADAHPDAGGNRAPTTLATLTGDLVLAMSMWQSVNDRVTELLRLWDSGRADATAREAMSRTIWGRLRSEAGQSGQTTLPEGTRLTDALLTQLRGRLAFDVEHADIIARLRRALASIVRSEDHADVGSDLQQRCGQLRAAHHRLREDSMRGADIAGRLRELEDAVARLERDAIVSAATRREHRRDADRAERLLAELGERVAPLRDLVERCRREILDPPLLAVPDPQRLGPVPQGTAVVDYLQRLASVERAMDVVETQYARPLRERAALRYRLGTAQQRARAAGREGSPTVVAARGEASDAVEHTPCDVTLATDLVEQYEYLVQPLPHARERRGTS